MRPSLALLLGLVLLSAMALVLWLQPFREQETGPASEPVMAKEETLSATAPRETQSSSPADDSLSREDLPSAASFGWTGRATFADGRPAQGLEVVVLASDRSRWADNYQVTDADGRYFIDGGPWATLKEEDAPFLFLRKASTQDNPVQALPASPPTEVDFQVEGETQVRVWVLHGATGEPVAEAPIRASNLRVSMEAHAQTNASGYADFLLQSGTHWGFRSTVPGVGTGHYTELKVKEESVEAQLILDSFPKRIQLMARDATTGAAIPTATYHSLHHDPQVLVSCVYELAKLPRVLPYEEGVLDMTLARPNPAWLRVEAPGYQPVQVSVSGQEDQTVPILMTPLRKQGVRILEQEKPTSGEIMLRYRPTYQAVGRYGHFIWRDPESHVFEVPASGFVEVWIPDKASQPEIFLSAKSTSGLRRYWRGLAVADFPESEWRIPLFDIAQVQVHAAAASSQSLGGRLPELECEVTLDPAARSTLDTEKDYRFKVELLPHSRTSASAYLAAPSTVRIRTLGLNSQVLTAHLVPGELTKVQFPY
ncbi:MAG: hypothetical protein ACPG31_03380 [Planctomycetota bacterium]